MFKDDSFSVRPQPERDKGNLLVTRPNRSVTDQKSGFELGIDRHSGQTMKEEALC